MSFANENDFEWFEESELAKKARLFATEHHKGQFRKDGVTPYITHPEAVVHILKKCKLYDNAIVVGWLHDVIEDCDVSIDTIRSEFGDRIAESVEELTFDSNKNDFKYSKDLYLANLAVNGSSLSIYVKCADRIHNTKSFMKSGDFRYAKKYFHKADCIFGALNLMTKNKILMDFEEECVLNMISLVNELERKLNEKH